MTLLTLHAPTVKSSSGTVQLWDRMMAEQGMADPTTFKAYEPSDDSSTKGCAKKRQEKCCAGSMLAWQDCSFWFNGACTAVYKWPSVLIGPIIVFVLLCGLGLGLVIGLAGLSEHEYREEVMSLGVSTVNRAHVFPFTAKLRLRTLSCLPALLHHLKSSESASLHTQIHDTQQQHPWASTRHVHTTRRLGTHESLSCISYAGPRYRIAAHKCHEPSAFPSIIRAEHSRDPHIEWTGVPVPSQPQQLTSKFNKYFTAGQGFAAQHCE